MITLCFFASVGSLCKILKCCIIMSVLRYLADVVINIHIKNKIDNALYQG